MQPKNVPKIGVMLGPHFVRMAGNLGFMKGYFNDYLSGIIPKPHNLTCVSAGSVIGLGICAFKQRSFDNIEKRLLSLKGSHFFGLNKELMFWGGFEALGPLMIYFPWEKIDNFWLRNLAKSAGIVAIEGLEVKLIDRLWSVSGIFSNERLRNLLMTSLRDDFVDIFNSDIKLDIVSANISGDKANDLNVLPYIVTNYKPEHKKPETIVDGVIRSTSITGFFGTTKTKGNEFTTDGGTYGAFPIEIPDGHGCNVIIVIQLSYEGQGYLEEDYTQWMSALHRTFDVLVDNSSARVLRGCLDINNDIEQIRKIESDIESLEALAGELPGEYRNHVCGRIQSMQESIENLTAYGKRHFNLIIVKSKRKIPEFNFRGKNFDKYMKLSIDIAQEAYEDTKPEILRAIDRVSV